MTDPGVPPEETYDPTGLPEVDAELLRLAESAGAETGVQVAVYEDVQQRLADVLAALDRQ
ncbi:hypothetical protein ACIRBX_34605 [Kitasatospora sp. NPDC096147]|uniref:hypothetical protein n=1 Tax=Kitasatospora sp. NPDC096147 TaxID=3364093 RepID=UPI00381C860D